MKPKHRLLMLLAVSGFLLGIYLFTQSHLSTSKSSEAHPSIILVQAAEADIDINIPKKLYPCLPKKVEKLRLLASNTTSRTSYYLVAIHLAPQPQILNEPPPPTYEQILVKLESLGCLVVVPKEKLGSVSLTQYIPELVARSLSLQRYRKAMAEVGGKEKFQQIWDKGDEEAGNVRYLFPEDSWALKQLGISIHPSVPVVTDVEELLAR